MTASTRLILAASLLAASAAWVLRTARPGPEATQSRRELAAIHVPQGFTVEKAAGADLVSYPMLGTVDDRGRLFLCESSGKTVRTPEMYLDPTYQVSMLEDLNGDGRYDRATVFADKLTLPAGAAWYRGSLYVAAPPHLYRFRDTNGDGRADEKEIVLTGWNLSANAASLHGPMLGPDGWLYLTDGRHGYSIRTKEGALLQGKASRIWRCRPDGTGLEWVAGGGFDNPVEVAFTPAGEMIATMTYFMDPRDGQRDALLHLVEGGVYPKPHPAASEFQRTGDWMPVMTKFARIAPSGLHAYRGPMFGAGYAGNLFSAHFNSHRVQRHVLHREGATFRTDDEDFLTSTDPDFHATDVMEDADGSLLVVDTGAWFIHGCPISRTPKPQIRGAIYRVRKQGAPLVEDPRGARLAWLGSTPEELVRRMDDARPAVRDRAIEAMVAAGDKAVPALRASVKSESVFALARIGTPPAMEAVRAALQNTNMEVRVAAARLLGMARDTASLPRLIEMAKRDEPAARRQAATALGQIGDRKAVTALLEAAANPEDRFVEHAIIYSLIQLKDAAAVTPALAHASPRVRQAALIALDQMQGSPIDRQRALALLTDADERLRQAALWVASHHPDWADGVVRTLEARLRGPLREGAAVRDAMVAFCGDAAFEQMAAGLLGSAALDAERQLLVLEAVERCERKQFPAAWVESLRRLMQGSDLKLRLRAVTLIRARGLTGLEAELERIAAAAAEPDELRLAAIGTLGARRPRLQNQEFHFLLDRLAPKIDSALRLAAAQVLSRAELSDEQHLTLARGYLPQADPLVLPILLEAFRNLRNEEAGAALVQALQKSPETVGTVGGGRLAELVKGFPPVVRKAARPLLVRIESARRGRLERLRKLEPLLADAGGDIGRGRRIFFGAKAACASCHTIGLEGGHVGPDLTAIGAIRSGHDLLEAIVLPSESFVPGHEVIRVETAREVYSGVMGSRAPDAVVLITGPNDEVRIPRSAIKKMGPAPVSLMPEGFDEVLTRGEMADLLAFLQAQKSRPTPGSAGTD